MRCSKLYLQQAIVPSKIKFNGQNINKEFLPLSRNVKIETHFSVVFILQPKFLNTDT